MKTNIGTIDRTVRILLAALVVVFYFTNVISGTVAIVLFIVAAIFLITAFFNFCPIWYFLGISTRKKQYSKQQEN